MTVVTAAGEWYAVVATVAVAVALFFAAGYSADGAEGGRDDGFHALLVAGGESS